jgi:hypothetical protein
MYKKTAYILFISLLFLASSCKKVKVKSVDKALTSGSWKVVHFSEDGDDETNHFNGYSFSFNDDGSVVATNSSTTISGTWSLNKDNSNDDSSSDVDLILNFPATNDFDELNDDWDIISQSDSRIELKDVSGGNGGSDLLTFEKK